MRQPCCICENTNAHMRLCDEHYADPANADWVEGDLEQPDEYIEYRVDEYERLRAAYDRAPLPVDDEVLQVAKLVVYGARKRYRRRDRQGRYRGYRTRREPVGVREIARLLGLSKSRVHRIISRIEG